jgi:hypothetical protein
MLTQKLIPYKQVFNHRQQSLVEEFSFSKNLSSDGNAKELQVGKKIRALFV